MNRRCRRCSARRKARSPAPTTARSVVPVRGVAAATQLSRGAATEVAHDMQQGRDVTGGGGELEKRLKLLESEVRGQVDLSHFGKPQILVDDPEE